MGRFGKIRGVEHHRWFGRLLGAGVLTSADLRSWLHTSFPALTTSMWDSCRKQADELLEAGVGVFRWDIGLESLAKVGGHQSKQKPPDTGFEARNPHEGDVENSRLFLRLGGGTGDDFSLRDQASFQSASVFCPIVFFGKGSLDLDRPMFAVFNSRKARLVSPESGWLKALGFFFHTLDSREIALAGSAGTLTYDLAGTLALRSGLLRLMVVPFPLLKADRDLLKTYGEGLSGIPVLSCMLDGFTCSGKQSPVCRDRVLAALVDLHLVLEIRSRGNLLAILEEIQIKSPRPQFVFEPGETNSANAGNYALLTKFPEHAHRFEISSSSRASGSWTGHVEVQRFSREDGLSSGHHKGRKKEEQSGAIPIPWCDYLFHYTRACFGPWPGEPYHQYLTDLLDGHPLSGHSALETLIRIVLEGLIRAGSRMVRGSAAVVSWSSHPPQEVFVMRKWNRALARWTVEPFGVAVKRDVLRSLGAKPAIYGNEQVYASLAESEKYRFQVSRSSPSSSWRHEREWRLRADFSLSGLRPDRGFLFVQTNEEKAKLCSYVNPSLPVVVINDCIS